MDCNNEMMQPIHCTKTEEEKKITKNEQKKPIE